MGAFAGAGPRILVVDDEEAVRVLLSKYLVSRGFDARGASNTEEALLALEKEPVDLVLADIQMPGRNGISLLQEARNRYPEIAVLMLTGCEDVSMAVGAMKAGAMDYVLKPFTLSDVEASVRQALDRRASMQAHSNRLRHLEETVQHQTTRVRQLLEHVNEASENTLDALVAALDAREHETKAHSRRVAEYSVRLAEAFGVHGDELEQIRRGAMLHDIGKIGISDTILLKPAPLTDAEWAEMRRHPEIGYWILRGMEAFRAASEIVLSHHERYNGQGYPRGLKGDEIPFGARIFSVADSLDAITSDRPYQRGHSFEAARDEIARNAGAQFDPGVVKRFLETPVHAWIAIRQQTLAEPDRPASSLPELVQHAGKRNQQ